MDASWIRKAPGLGELVREAMDERGGRRSKTAIVIPTFRAEAQLGEHLRLLARQSTKDFDVIIVYDPGDVRARQTHGLRIVHIWRNWGGGSAGGFYTGEKFAIKEGYEFVILADDDCFPVSETLVENLVGEAARGLAMPLIRSGKLPPAPNGIISHYGCIRADILAGAGLTYLPFYMGGEDVELLGRIEATGLRAAITKDTAAHPASSLIACPPAKAFGYVRGGAIKRILIDSYPSSAGYFFSSFMGALAMTGFNPGVGRAVLAGLLSAARMDFSATELEAKPRTEEARGVEIVNAGALEYILRLPAYFGKGVIFEDKAGLAGVPILLLARKGWLRSGSKSYLISDNRFFFLFPLWIALIVAGIPLAAIAAILLPAAGYLIKRSLGITTQGYGTA